jgi:hypothetical protein
MAEEFKTLREVAIAMQGVQRQFTWHTGVFGVAVTIAMAGYWFMFTKIDRVEDSATRIETKLVTMDDKLNRIGTDTSSGRAEVGDVKNMLSGLSVVPQNRRPPSSQEGALVASLKGVLPSDKFAKLETGAITYGDYAAIAASLTDEQRTQIKRACVDALRTPEPFPLYLLGFCGAVVNQ